VTKGANNTAAQSNLQNALTGAKTYFTDTNQSYVGLETANAGTSDISQIGTGLTWVTGTKPSPGPHTISAAVLGNGSALELAAFANGTNDCWGILDVTAAGATAIDGISGSAAVGTYFFVLRSTTTASCNAAGYLAGTTAVSASSATGFPHG